MSNKKIVKKLPVYHQTDKNRKFLGSTAEQLLAKTKNKKVSGNIGRKDGSFYNPMTSFYKEEVDKNRQNYQLEPAVVAKQTKTKEYINSLHFIELLDVIRQNGGIVNNHERLFGADYYSFAPPIDIDKFLNFQNYAWIKYIDDLPYITIHGLTEADIDTYIAGNNTYNTSSFGTGLEAYISTDPDAVTPDGVVNNINEITVNIVSGGSGYANSFVVTHFDDAGGSFDITFTVFNGTVVSATVSNLSGNIGAQLNTRVELTPENVEFSSGFVLFFPEVQAGKYYNKKFFVEGVNSNNGILLVEAVDRVLAGYEYRNLLWDVAEEPWDLLNWDVVIDNIGADYITIERGSCDRNSWSVTNRWIHLDVLSELSDISGIPLPSNLEKGRRPILEFKRDLELYKSGKKWVADVDIIAGCKKASEEESNPTTCDSWTFNDVHFALLGLEVDGRILQTGDLIVFINDPAVADTIWRVVTFSNHYVLIPEEVVSDGDTIYVNDGVIYGNRTYFYNGSGWERPYLEKTKENQPPLFELYTCQGNRLSDESLFPETNFRGSKIFSYKESTSNVPDSVLNMRLTYSGLGQISDIVFENNLETETYYYVENFQLKEIDGYYFYSCLQPDDACEFTPVLQNEWWPGNNYKKHRIIDRFEIEDTSIINFELSAVPYNKDVYAKLNGDKKLEGVDFSLSNKEVIWNGVLNKGDVLEFFTYSVNNIVETFQVNDINQRHFKLSHLPALNEKAISLTGTVTGQIYDFAVEKNVIVLHTTAPALTLNEVLTAEYVTENILDENASGYYEVPDTLEKNPLADEVTALSYNDFVNHFLSIINNQNNTNTGLGESNYYRDTPKNPGLGEHIVQHVSSLVKYMFMSSSEDTDIFASIDFAASEYERFKRKFLKFVKVVNDENGFNTYTTDRILSSSWFNKVIDKLKQEQEHPACFANSYMLPAGNNFEELEVVIANQTPDINGDINISLPTSYSLDNNDLNILVYSYNSSLPTSSAYSLLVSVDDYDIVKGNNAVIVKLKSQLVSTPGVDNVYIRLYKDSYINVPATPSKLGLYGVCKPRIVTIDTSPFPGSPASDYILGHDGSLTPVFGDVRDDMLIEFETRVYNCIDPAFKDADYKPLVVKEDVYPGKFRFTNWTKDEINEIQYKSFEKWKSEYNVELYENTTYDSSNIWSYNYRDHQTVPETIPGFWKGIYDYFYDTDTPHLTPWKCLGFLDKPLWWDTVYGINYSASNTLMWQDIEAGFIRSPFNSYYDSKYARNGLTSNFMPVDSAGNLLDPYTIGIVSDPSLMLDSNKQRGWVFGDGSVVEESWKRTSLYPFSVVKLLMLTKPALVSDFFFNTLDITRSKANTEQIVSASTCKRITATKDYVHGEHIPEKDMIAVRHGYQQWVSDYVLSKNKLISDTLANVKYASVQLSHKVGGFLVKDNMRFETSVSTPGSNSDSELLPYENIYVEFLDKPSALEPTYSGVTIQSIGNDKYRVYGFNKERGKFFFYPRKKNGKAYDISVGGKEATWVYFYPEKEYIQNQIVKYNGQYYKCTETHFAYTFNRQLWKRLNKLPLVGALSVSYIPESDYSITKFIKYGAELSLKETFDFLVGYGDYLEKEGWVFNQYNEFNEKLDFLFSAKQFLQKVYDGFETNEVITLSPFAAGLTFRTTAGVPDNLDEIHNGIYGVFSSDGTPLRPEDLTISRNIETDVNEINIRDESNKGIYYARIPHIQYEHTVIFDNVTSFDDVVYNLLLGERQPFLQFNGIVTDNWLGRYEAEGYVIDSNTRKILPNVENSTTAIRKYFDTESVLDSREIENLARHLIGYEEKEYLNNISLSDDSQYQFYQGMIREKGTIQAIKKILRSDAATNKQKFEIFEEWALKLSDFGAVEDCQSIEVLISANEIKTNTQIVTLHANKSNQSYVKDIIIVENSDTYTEAPEIIITRHPEDTGNGNGATAISVLDSNGKLAEIKVIDGGCGYLKEPLITIVGSINDKAVSVLQPLVVNDTPLDDTINIDVDDNARWLVKPRKFLPQKMWPTKKFKTFEMPYAGYVHPADVKFTAFGLDDLHNYWNGNVESPKVNSLFGYNSSTDTLYWSTISRDNIWIANNYNDDWCVYGVHDTGEELGDTFAIIKEDEQLYIETTNELNTNVNNLRVLPKVIVLNFIKILSKVPLRVEEEQYLLEIEETSVAPTTYNYRYKVLNKNDFDLETEVIARIESDIYSKIRIWEFITRRFKNLNERTEFSIDYPFMDNELTWIDENDEGCWEVQKLDGSSSEWKVHSVTDVNGGVIKEIKRKERNLLDTSKFINSYIYDYETKETDLLLPVIDPIKGLIPGIADKNITYKSYSDPALYNNAKELNLIDYTYYFGKKQVGKTWWDLSKFKYIYYEQGTNHDRKQNWGKLFPGSEIAVYEWVESNVPPEKYNGPGEVKDVNNYSEEYVFDSNNQKRVTKYYFWVKGLTTFHKDSTRTLSVAEVELLLTDPNNLEYKWFSPINYQEEVSQKRTYEETYTLTPGTTFVELPRNDAINVRIFVNNIELDKDVDYYIPQCSSVINFNLSSSLLNFAGETITVIYEISEPLVNTNTFIFSNVRRYIEYKDSVFQINWLNRNKNSQKHVEWLLIKENDNTEVVPAFYWKKILDSLFGRTKIIEWNQDVPGFVETEPGKGFLLVPDPSLSEVEKYGISTRPRQTLFVDNDIAFEKVLKLLNSMLSAVQMKEKFPEFYTLFASELQVLWENAEWVKPDFIESSDSNVYYVNSLNDIQTLTGLKDNDIINVSNINFANKYPEVYVIENNSYIKVKEINGTIKFSEDVLHKLKVVNSANKFREILEYILEEVFVNEYASYKTELFFYILRHILSEKQNFDWVFKTTYISIKQSGLLLEKKKFYTNDYTDSAIEYIKDVKPYRAKVRSVEKSVYLENELALFYPEDSWIFEIIQKFARYSCSGWDTTLFGSSYWDGEMYGVENSGCELYVDPLDSCRGWDSRIWDEYAWDNEMLHAFASDCYGNDADYFTGSDSSLPFTQRFDEIVPPQSEVSDGSTTVYTLNFTPSNVLGGPWVFVNGNVYYNFIYDSLSNAITFVDVLPAGNVIEIFDVPPIDEHSFSLPLMHPEIPQERVTFSATEFITFSVIRDDTQIKLIYDQYGNQSIYRVCDGAYGLLSNQLNLNDTKIIISMASINNGLLSASVLHPGMVIIKNELISYSSYVVTGDSVNGYTVELGGIQRGKYGSHVYSVHNVNTHVYFLHENNRLSGMNFIDGPFETGDFTESQEDFLANCSYNGIEF